MSDAEDLDFELVTNANQLATPPELRRELVVLKEWKTKSGKASAFYEWELSAVEHGKFMESGRIYKDGRFIRYDQGGEEVRYLAWTTRDAHGNRVWHSVEAAKGLLGQLGKGELAILLDAANRVNSAKEGATAGNFEETPSDS